MRTMPHQFCEAAVMALCCLLLAVSCMVYPVAAFQAVVQAGSDSGTEAVAVSRGAAGLPEIALNSSQLPVPNLKLHKLRGQVRELAVLSDYQIRTPGPCSSKDISIAQKQSGSSGGIPEFTVQILNNCASGCLPSNIHVHCGWFASASAVNPDKFKRLAFDDCLVNGGKGLRYGTMLTFTYGNSFLYPLSFKSASFC